ncbi:MAG: histone H1 [Chlorobiales bacterium]|jgi:hypothetical protein|nr:histone H1 [Chlorobiales bacterium]
MNRYQELKAMIEAMEEDFSKFFEKGNKSAGTRVRKHMSDLKALAQQIRVEVQEMKTGSES